MRVCIVVPTLNPGRLWDAFSAALLENLADLGLPAHSVLILDSASNDGTLEKATAAGFRVHSISRDSFDHGGTRQVAVALERGAEFLVYLTQDAVLAQPDAIRILLKALENPAVGAAYGRQLPRPQARSVEVHARLFNYPPVSRLRSFADRQSLGFKSIFASNSFCAYRRSALISVGGFPQRAICSEESIAIGRMHIEGWQSAYVAEATVYHSHGFTVAQEFQRYFDVGVTHAREPFMLEMFGTANGEGKRFVISEFRYLLEHEPSLIPSALLRTLTKLIGYRLGRKEAQLSLAMRRRLSMNGCFWRAECTARDQRSARAPIQGARADQWLASSAQRVTEMIPHPLQAKQELRRPAELATEVVRTSPVQQQRVR
ncbi:glycosyltransferase family 2 protein [Acidipila sp. EB88]|uniref:glycosyltransferase n=1 Tax=Acidipila sp. EB88 TaxID=2305226 RepID=UPI0018F38DB1|nr:glycosyltransferase [Acidipila sp. EB88]